MPKITYPEHLIFDRDGAGRPIITCTRCDLSAERKIWMSDGTWIMFSDSFLADHASPRHKRIEGNSLHKEGRG